MAFGLVFAASGCTSENAAGSTGALALDLELGDGVLVDIVTWRVTREGMPPMAGEVDTSAPGSTASLEVFGLPPGDGYTITMEATSRDGETACAGDAGFAIDSGEVTEVAVMLYCKRGPTFGGIRVDGSLNVCAELVKAVVSPLTTSVGQDIDLLAEVVDAEGDAVKLSWSAGVGTIADSSAAATTYRCEQPGDDDVRIVVSDDGFAHCMSDWTVRVACVPTDDRCASVSCPDLGICAVSECDEETGQCESRSAPDGTDCTAENPPLAECQAGVCSALGCASDQDCDDGNACTANFCDLGTGICNNIPKSEGERCMLVGVPFAVCMAGACTESACTEDAQCDPVTQCTVRGVCDLQTGACGPPVPVENGEPCVRGANDPGVCIDGFCGCADDSVCPEATACRSAGICELESGLCRFGPPVNQGGACDYRGRGPESGRCADGFCRAACTANPCRDRGLPCVRDVCDPMDGSCDPMNRLPGTICTLDDAPGRCDGNGTCEVSLCAGVNCPAGPCVTGTCDPADGQCIYTKDPPGTVCFADGSFGVCDEMGACVPPRCETDEPIAKAITVACTNSVTISQSPLPFTLEVTLLEPIEGGSEFDVAFSGSGVFPQFFLNAAQGVVNGGVDEAILDEFVATVQVRSGATGPDVALGPDVDALTPGPTRFCNFPTDQICANDAECLGGVCNPPVTLVDIPTSADCAVGGVCDQLGRKGSQCDVNGFCVTGDLVVPFETSAPTSYSAEPSGQVLFGWADQGVPGLVVCPAPAPSCQNVWMPDGCYDIPNATYGDPAAPLGIRVNVDNALFVPIQCAMADWGGLCASGEGCVVDADCGTPPCTRTADVACPTPDSSLIGCPIN